MMECDFHLQSVTYQALNIPIQLIQTEDTESLLLSM